MKVRSRLVPALLGYVILILVPICLLVLQGLQSLSQKKEDINRSSRTELQAQDEHLRYTLEREWDLFLDFEQSRPIDHYFPVIQPNKEVFRTQDETVAFQRSPLFGTLTKGYTTSSSGQQTIHLFQAALMGYFEYDPANKTISSPYDPQGFFQETPDGYEHYYAFLEEKVFPELNDFLELEEFRETDPLSLLLKLKTHRTHKVPVPRLAFSEVLDLSEFEDKSAFEVSYYNFKFHSFSKLQDDYLIGFRAVLVENQLIRLQGFIIHMFKLLQEIQAYLEPLQPDFGQVVVGSSVEGGSSFLRPFGLLSSTIVIHDDYQAIANFKKEERRFWKIMVTLIVILLISSLVLARLIVTETRLNQKKTDFISAVTHELKTPLTSIKMYAEMLEEGWAKGKEMAYYRHISSESQRLTRLIGNVLNFAQLEKGSFNVNMIDMELDSFLSETIGSWETWLDEFGLQVHLHSEHQTWISADPDALKQVLYNLCDNAIKYAKNSDGSELTFKLFKENDEAILMVYDNGPGVSKAEHGRIFEKFYRIESEWTRESTGTGLGLALVKEIILKCSGSLKVYTPEQTNGFGLVIRFPLLTL